MKGELGEVESLHVALESAKDDLEQAETALKSAKERVRKLTEEDIPAAMQELGYKKVVLANGAEVTVKAEVYASIPVKHRRDAHEWLDANGFGSLIRATISAQFGRGEKDDADRLLDTLRSSGIDADKKEAVHPQTLKAFLREQLEKGNDVPLHLFGARPVDVAVIKPPKK